MIFSDEIYDRLVMDDLEHVSTASLAPDLPMITFNGLSKSHYMRLPVRMARFERPAECTSEVHATPYETCCPQALRRRASAACYSGCIKRPGKYA